MISGACARRLARVTGAFYVATILTGLFAELFRERTVVFADAVATSQHILASQSLYRASVAADLIGGICYLVVTLLLYELLKPVSARISLLAASFSFLGIAVGAVGTVIYLGPLIMLGGAHYLATFEGAQLQSLAYVFVKLHSLAYIVALIFFGFYCALLGYLVYRSGYLPRTVGVLLAIAGVSYLINSFANILSPPLADALSSFILLPTLIGEASLTLWLVIFGLDARKWDERAANYSLSGG